MRVVLNHRGRQLRKRGSIEGTVISFRWLTYKNQRWIVFRVIFDGTKTPKSWSADYFEAAEGQGP